MDTGWTFHLGDVSVTEDDLDLTYEGIKKKVRSGLTPGVPDINYDDSDWEHVVIPHDWQAHMPFESDAIKTFGYKKRGKAWYRKVFNLPEEYKDCNITIDFGGILTHAKVYFNGAVMHRSYSGYTPFEIDITDRAKFGDEENVLAVYVDASEYEDAAYEGAGIYRHVTMKVMNYIHIPKYGINIRMKEVSSNVWKVNLFVNVINMTSKNEKLRIVTTLVDADRELQIDINNEGVLSEAGEECQVETEFTIEDPKIWDIDEPNTYNVLTQIYLKDEIIDQDKTVCGFRTIEIDPEKGFLLNKRPIKLFGTVNSHTFSGLGAALPDGILEYKLHRLKNMGSNAYRCKKGMASDELVSYCDKIGILLIDENSHLDTSENNLRSLRTMVMRDRNHPSVIMYSLCDDEYLQNKEEGERIARHMCNEIFRLDQDKLITAGLSDGFLDDVSVDNELDICGINFNHDKYDEYHKLFPDKPIIAMATTSAYAVRGEYNTDKEKIKFSNYDEDFGVIGQSLRDTWKQVFTHDYIIGACMWSGFDYMGGNMPCDWPEVFNVTGLMDSCGFPKDGYFYIKALFNSKPFVHVLPHWNHKGREGEIIRVMSMTNCEEAELIVNKKSMGRKKVNLFKQVVWEVPYEPGYIELIGYNSGVRIAHDVKITTGRAVRLKVVPYRTKMYNDGADTIPVKIVAIDSRGNEVVDADIEVKVDCKGGEILLLNNGDPVYNDTSDNNIFKLFNGKGQAIVRALQGEKELILTVSSKDLGVGTIVIPLMRKEPLLVVEEVKKKSKQLRAPERRGFFT